MASTSDDHANAIDIRCDDHHQALSICENWYWRIVFCIGFRFLIRIFFRDVGAMRQDAEITVGNEYMDRRCEAASGVGLN